MQKQELTSKTNWESYWNDKKKIMTSLLISEILRIAAENLPPESKLKILEIGGAPGDVLIYFTKKFDYCPSSLDYSDIGNKQTLENFRNAGLEVEVYERDLFSDEKVLPIFDIVYSLGFIEHFEDLNYVVEKHLEYLKPGGILMLGVPNLLGIYHWFLKYLAPSHDKTHNLKIMDVRSWKSFETKFSLSPVFVQYIGGFEPLKMKKYEVNTIFNKILYFFVKVLMVFFSFKMTFLRKINSKYWSGYLLGVYRK